MPENDISYVENGLEHINLKRGPKPDIDWLDEAIKREATPKSLRTNTVEEFCKVYDLPVSTYYYHISKQENKKRVLEVTLNKAKDEAPEILEVLVDMAKKRDIRAIDIYMDSILQLAKNLDITSQGKSIVQLSAEIIEKNSLPNETHSSAE